MYPKYNKNNLNFARYNRKARNATRQEGILWHTFLNKAPIRFTRQYRVENYILDFYAPKIKLAIEIDGSEHYEDKKEIKDLERTKVLNNLGIEVVRYTNLDIDKRLNIVKEDITNKINELLKK